MTLLLLAALAFVAAAVVTLSGGFSWRLWGLTIVSRQPQRALLIGVLLLGSAVLLLGVRAFGERVRALGGNADARAARMAAAASLAVLVVSIAWNTRAAGGSDSSCYLLQAQAFAERRATLSPGILLPPGTPPAVFAPIGFLPSPLPPFAPVPICAAGLALVMAPAIAISPAAPFLVAPVLAALAVWLTFVFGRQLGDPVVGVCAAILLACSPIFLYQSVQPMSDIPATTAWLAALTFCARGERRAAFAAGMCASVAVLMRPNLALLVAALPVLLTDSVQWRLFPFPQRGNGDSRRFRAGCFIAGGVPGAMTMLALNGARYGSAFASGYGSTDALFAAAHLAPNLARYPRWLLETQTPFVLLAAAAPWLLWRAGRRRVALVGSVAVAATFGTYLAYTVFDDWWYIRFLLPALPILLVFSVAVLARIAPAAVTVAICLALASWYVHVASERHVFELQALESRFPVTGAYAARALPPDAVILSVQQSGSLRYHGGRATMTWDAIAPDALDATIAWLRGQGAAPFIALEDGEEPRFRERFRTQTVGQLDWPPAAQIMTPVRVRIYRPTDRARFFAGERLAIEYVR